MADLWEFPMIEEHNEEPLSFERNDNIFTIEEITGDQRNSQQACSCMALYAPGPSDSIIHCPIHSRSDTRTLESHDPELVGRKSGVSCLVCGKDFPHKSHLNIHMRTHTKERPFLCPYCDLDFAHKQNLERHVRLHTGDRPYSCGICGKDYTNISNLGTHMRSHTNQKPYSCKVCYKSFSQKSNLNAHMRSHTGERPFSCSFCDRRFSFKGNRDKHMTSHTIGKPYSCQICGRGFRSNRGLKSHEKVHESNECSNEVDDTLAEESSEMLLSCEEPIDDLGFNQRQNSNTQSHRNNNPLECPPCGNSFGAYPSSDGHMKTHSCQQLSSCVFCGKTFKDRSNLKRHEDAHIGNKPYQCSACGKRFNRKDTMTYHASHSCLKTRKESSRDTISARDGFQDDRHQYQDQNQRQEHHEHGPLRLGTSLQAPIAHQNDGVFHDILTRALTTNEEVLCDEDTRRRLDLIIEDINNSYHEKYGK